MEKEEYGTSVTRKQEVEKTRVLSFSDLLHKLKEKSKALARNPKYVKDLLRRVYSVVEKLEKLRRKKIVRIDLEIPRELAKKLGSGKVMEVDGIIRQTGEAAVANLLREIRPSGFKKISKVKNISFTALDTLEAVLVDRKLTDISEKVDDIDGKLDAQRRGALKSALQQMKELSMIQNPDIKRNKILLVQDRLNQCEHMFDEMYGNKWQRLEALKEKSEKSTFSNKGKLKDMCEIGEQLPVLLEPVILCKIGQVKLFEMQGEFTLAQEKAFDLAGYVAEKLETFKKEFSARSLENLKYKNVTDFNRPKTIAGLKDRLEEPNELMEYLLNTTLSFVLTVPEDTSPGPADENGKDQGPLYPVKLNWWRRFMQWLKRLFAG
jgi:hypothetical protein